MGHLIDIDKVIEEVEKKTYGEQGFRDEDSEYGYRTCARDILAFLDILETKEDDLEEEITNQIRLLNGVHTLDNGKQWWKGTYDELSYFAKHFFELGLKAQKGE